jgi:hypothetical protein
MTARWYAYTPALDPATGDWARGGSERPASAPATQIVLWTLRTPKRSFLPDLTLGPDYDLIQKQTPNAAAAWKASVEEALDRYVRRGVIAELRVVVDPPAKGRLLYLVDFVDPRARSRAREPLRLVA